MRVGVVASAGSPTVSANRASNRRGRSRFAYARSVPVSGFRAGTNRQRPLHDAVAACDKSLWFRAIVAANRAIGATTPQPAGTSPGDRVRRNELGHRRDGNRSSRTSFCEGPRESWACGRRAADTAPEAGQSRSVGPAANRVLADTPATESAVSVHRAPFDSRTACLDWQNTADRAEIPGKDGRCPQEAIAMGSDLKPAP